MPYLIGTAIWIICMVAASNTARAKGRSANAWAILGFLTGPLAWMLVSVLPPLVNYEAQEMAERQQQMETKECPHCLSRIPRRASVCRYCQRDVVPPAPRPGDPIDALPGSGFLEPGAVIPNHAADCKCVSCYLRRERLKREEALRS